MAPALRTLRVFVGSPSDLADERPIVPKVADEVNRIKAHAMGLHLEVHGWEDTLPGHGRPQELINGDLDEADLAVLILWKRWGTETGTHSSGFFEEFQRCQSSKKPLLLYLKDIPPNLLDDPGPQLQAVLRFQEVLQREKAVLYSSFDTSERFEIQLRYHLCKWLDEHVADAIPDDMLIRPGAWLRSIAKDDEMSRKLVSRVISVAEHHARVADVIADEAGARLESGFTQRAEYLYQTALTLHPSIDALHGYQHLLLQTGRRREATELLSKLKDYVEEGTDIRARIFVLEGEGNIALEEGNLKRAKDAFEETARLGRENELFDTTCVALTHIAEIARIQGDFSRSLAVFNEAVEIGKRAETPRHMIGALNHRTNLLVQAGRADLAKKDAQQGYELATRFGIPREASIASMLRATVASSEADHGQAVKYLEEALANARRSGEKGLEAAFTMNLGVVLLQSGDLERAPRTFEDALRLNAADGNYAGLGDTSFNLATTFLARGRPAEAVQHARKAVEVFERLGDDHKITLARKLLSRISSGA